MRFAASRTLCAFSADCACAEVLDMTKKFMNDPIQILVKRDELTLEGIKQFFIAVEKEEARGFALSSLTLRVCP